MNYLKWNEKTITDFTPENVTKMYNDGYVFTRLGKGVMQQTRSVRIDLKKFAMTSENRRILKKVTDLESQAEALPLKEYDIAVGKLAKDFYETKFGPGIMSAQKVKEMLTEKDKSNFNAFLTYKIKTASAAIGFSICYVNKDMTHYSYPFYDLTTAPKDMGLAMMILAIEHAREAGLKYAYLGSLQRPTDTYKLQFEGLEWFDGKAWQTNIEEVKKILTSAKM